MKYVYDINFYLYNMTLRTTQQNFKIELNSELDGFITCIKNTEESTKWQILKRKSGLYIQNKTSGNKIAFVKGIITALGYKNREEVIEDFRSLWKDYRIHSFYILKKMPCFRVVTELINKTTKVNFALYIPSLYDIFPYKIYVLKENQKYVL